MNPFKTFIINSLENSRPLNPGAIFGAYIKSVLWDAIIDNKPEQFTEALGYLFDLANISIRNWLDDYNRQGSIAEIFYINNYGSSESFFELIIKYERTEFLKELLEEIAKAHDFFEAMNKPDEASRFPAKKLIAAAFHHMTFAEYKGTNYKRLEELALAVNNQEIIDIIKSYTEDDGE